MANPITEFKGAEYDGFVTSMSAFSFHMKPDDGLNSFEKQTRITSENSGMAFIIFFIVFCFLQFKICNFDIIRVYEFNFSDFFYIVQKKYAMHSF